MEAKCEVTVRTCSLFSYVLVGVIPNTPFLVSATNLTKKVGTEPRHSKWTKLVENPTVIVNTLDNIDIMSLNTQNESVNAWHIYTEKVTKTDLARQHDAMVQQVPKTIKTDWKTSLNVNDKYGQYWPYFEGIMSHYADVCDDHLGRISVTKHVIVMTPSVRRFVRYAPYRASPRQKALKGYKVDKMLKQNFAEYITSG